MLPDALPEASGADPSPRPGEADEPPPDWMPENALDADGDGYVTKDEAEANLPKLLAAGEVADARDQERGIIDVKGKGQVKAYWLIGKK